MSSWFILYTGHSFHYTLVTWGHGVWNRRQFMCPHLAQPNKDNIKVLQYSSFVWGNHPWHPPQHKRPSMWEGVSMSWTHHVMQRVIANDPGCNHVLQIDNMYTNYWANVSGIYSETCLQRPPNGILLCLLELIKVQKAEIVSKSKLVPSVFIKTH